MRLTVCASLEQIGKCSVEIIRVTNLTQKAHERIALSLKREVHAIRREGINLSLKCDCGWGAGGNEYIVTIQCEEQVDVNDKRFKRPGERAKSAFQIHFCGVRVRSASPIHFRDASLKDHGPSILG